MNRPSLLGIVLAVIGTGVMAGLSQLPYRAETTDRAVLRLSWRYEPGDEAGCRLPTSEELAELPPHMRNPNACVRTPTPYLLQLRVDGQTVLERTLRAAGAREDRPVFVYEEVTLEAGERTLDVLFEALAGTTEAGTVPDPPMALSWSETVTVEPRDIVVIGHDRIRGVLERVDAAGR